MRRTPGEVSDTASFDHALRLHSTSAEVALYNASKLYAGGQPVAMLKAVHTGPGA